MRLLHEIEEEADFRDSVMRRKVPTRCPECASDRIAETTSIENVVHNMTKFVCLKCDQHFSKSYADELPPLVPDVDGFDAVSGEHREEGDDGNDSNN